MKTLILFLFLLPSAISAQSFFINRGQSATTIQGNYASARDASVVGIELGHSFNGIFDLGLTAGLGSSNGSGPDVTFWGPSFSLLFFNSDSAQGPVLSADFAYVRTSYGSSYSPYGGQEITGSTFAVGGTAGVRLQLTPGVTMLPLFTGGSSTTSVQNYSQSAGFYGFGISWIFRAGRATRFVLTPSVSSSNSVSTFGIEAGAVFLH